MRPHRHLPRAHTVVVLVSASWVWALASCRSGRIEKLDQTECTRRATDLALWLRKLAAEYSSAVEIWPWIKLAVHEGKRLGTLDRRHPFEVRASLEPEQVEMEVDYFWRQERRWAPQPPNNTASTANQSRRQPDWPKGPPQNKSIALAAECVPPGCVVAPQNTKSIPSSLRLARRSPRRPYSPTYFAAGPKLKLDLFAEPPKGQKEVQERPLPAGPWPAYVAVDPGAPWAVVQAVLRALGHRGARPLHLLFHQRPVPQPPAASFLEPWVRETLRRVRDPTDPSQPASPMEGEPEPIRRLYRGCPAVEKMFEDKVGPVDPSLKAGAVAQHIDRALESCRCAIDFDALRAALWIAFVPGREPKTVVPLFVAHGQAACDHMETGGAGIWKDVHLNLIEMAQRCGQRGVALDIFGSLKAAP